MSAQSMSSSGIAYNEGKLAVVPQNELKSEGYPEQFTYLLPSNELASKYMAISAYNGSFSISRLKDFGFSKEYLNEILDFCISEGLLYKGNHDRVFVSRKGFVHYGALFSLFYSNTQFSQKEKK